ncbi:MAG: type II toxin-antitoxin system antitoxin SocA domain-containing protein [Betaproteobacteria bacterium]
MRSPEKELLELSDADQEILEEVWKKFGRMDQWRLRDYTHRHCPEWTDPEGSMIPMEPKAFLAALKFTPRRIKATLERLREEDGINAAFDAVKE